MVVEQGLATAEEMTTIGAAWRAWGTQPGAITTGWWFEAVGWAE